MRFSVDIDEMRIGDLHNTGLECMIHVIGPEKRGWRIDLLHILTNRSSYGTGDSFRGGLIRPLVGSQVAARRSFAALNVH